MKVTLQRDRSMMNLYISEFIESKGLQPGDVVLVRHLGLGALRQFVPYLGKDSQGFPRFAIKMTTGYRYLSPHEHMPFLQSMVPYQIMRFQGNASERNLVVRKALANLNDGTFNLLLNWSDGSRKPAMKKQDASPDWGGIVLGAAALALLIALFGKDDK